MLTCYSESTGTHYCNYRKTKIPRPVTLSFEQDFSLAAVVKIIKASQGNMQFFILFSVVSFMFLHIVTGKEFTILKTTTSF